MDSDVTSDSVDVENDVDVMISKPHWGHLALNIFLDSPESNSYRKKKSNRHKSEKK